MKNEMVSIAEPKEMTLTFPIGAIEAHPLHGAYEVQAYLSNGWVLDGNILHDFQTNRIIVKLKRLE